MRGRLITNPDPVMLTLLDLHSQGYTPREACEVAAVDNRYWERHKRTFLDALCALNMAQAVREALERGLIGCGKSNGRSELAALEASHG